MTPQNEWSFINWDEKNESGVATGRSLKAAATCLKCRAELPPQLINTGAFEACPSCKSEIKLEVFPAMFRAPERGSTGEALVVESHASCFYHAQKQAAIVCAGCGRFICSLCDVEVEGQHLCPPCLETSHKQGKLKSLESRRVLHETVALHLAILSIPLFYISFITAPLALFWAFKHRKTPSSVVRGNKVRWWSAVVLSTLLLLGWIALVAVIAIGISSNSFPPDQT